MGQNICVICVYTHVYVYIYVCMCVRQESERERELFVHKDYRHTNVPMFHGHFQTTNSNEWKRVTGCHKFSKEVFV